MRHLLLVPWVVGGVACGDGVAAPADAAGPDAALADVVDPVPLIDPTIGTGGLGFAYGASFVGAAWPHGLVKLGPDTNGPFGVVGFQHYSGYHADDDRIQGFSHLHLHGAGLVDYGVLSVMPTRAFDPAKRSVVDYQARFAKADEHAAAGTYRVTLADGTTVRLIATPHGAHHVYDFGGAAGTLVLDLAKTLAGGVIDDAELHLDPAGQRATGRLHHRGDMSGNFGGYDLFFALRTRGAWTDHALWADGSPSASLDGSGAVVGAALGFAPGAPVEFQVAVSLVDVDGAEANLATELPTWDADAAEAAVSTAWREVTGAVLVAGGDLPQRRIFYASLYHAFLMPTVMSDVDGRYRLAGELEPRSATHHQMTDMSLWDTYRTVHPLYALLAPASALDAARSLLAFGEATGGLPRWPIATGESGTMLGSPAEIVLGDALVRGVPIEAEVATAWPMLRAAALDEVAPPGGRGTRAGIEPYLTLGYLPSDLAGRSVSATTEYSHADRALATLADAVGADADATTLRSRSTGWRALFDDRVGFLRARASDGSFASIAGFDPTEQEDAYAEANAWQSLWMSAIHDPDGLAALLGGPAAAVAKLEALFALTADEWNPDDPTAGLSPRPYYWHGNEPDLNAAWLFAQLGRPDLSQTWVRWIADHLYADTPTGVPGNDDGGTLGAWYVWAALGLYPVPGTGDYLVGAPMFRELRVDVGDGHTLIIEAPGAPTLPYVAGVELDGVPVAEATLRHADLIAATRLTFTLSAVPTTWGQ